MQQTPNLDRFFATPALYFPDMNNEEWEFELERMFQRTMLTREFVENKLTPDQYGQALDSLGIDIIQATTDWDNALVYL